MSIVDRFQHRGVIRRQQRNHLALKERVERIFARAKHAAGTDEGRSGQKPASI